MLITAVSGSLDRLSAEKDPPVRYDNTYKVWVYLHGHRSINSEKWGEQVDNETLRAYERHTEKYNKNKTQAYKNEITASPERDSESIDTNLNSAVMIQQH